MNNAFSPLEEDNDVLLLNKDTFTVSRLKELLENTVKSKLSSTLAVNHSNLFTTVFCTFSIGGDVGLLLNNLQWRNHPIDCQLLKVGSKGWQKGKVIIQINTVIYAPNGLNKFDIGIEFSPDEPTVPESPLDDLRQLPEYKQQS